MIGHMRNESVYDLVFELDYPLGESSEIAYQVWGVGIEAEIHNVFEDDPATEGHRVVRTGNHLKIMLKVHSLQLVSPTIGWVFSVLAGQSPADVVVRVHECEPVTVGAVERNGEELS
jgi:hypothetical protein